VQSLSRPKSGATFFRLHTQSGASRPRFSLASVIRANWRRLEEDLRDLAVSGDAELGRDSPYGQKYEIRGTLSGPAGRSAGVLTVWIILFGGDVPQFVTAFPGEMT